MTVINLGNIRFNWRGSYDPTASYVLNDVVAYSGSSYVALADVTGVVPTDTSQWGLVASGTDQLTTQGDLVFHNSVQAARLPIGQENQMLNVQNGQPAWIDLPLDPSRRVAHLARSNNGSDGTHVRFYVMADGTIKGCGIGSNFSNGDTNGSHTYVPSRLTTTKPDVQFVSIHNYHYSHYALTTDGDVWSWGYNGYGNLGNGGTANNAVARPIQHFISNNIKIAQIITPRMDTDSYNCVFFLTTDGRVYACGYGGNGQLGNGATANQYTPVRCGTLENIVSVAVSGQPMSVFAIDNTGQVFSWGWNNNGQLGHGDGTQRNSPTLISSMSDVVKVVPSAGRTTAAAVSYAGSAILLRSDGTIWGAGYNGYGGLGLGNTTARSSFTPVPSTETFTDIISGPGYYNSSAAITTTGDLYVWGYNGYGQLGLGDTSQRTSPVKQTTDFGGPVTKALFGGGRSYNGLVVQSGNMLWSAGYSANGNIGRNTTAGTNNTFQPVLGLSGTIKEWDLYGNGQTAWGISVLYDDGRVDACGYNNYGELGTQTANLHHERTLKNVHF